MKRFTWYRHKPTALKAFQYTGQETSDELLEVGFIREVNGAGTMLVSTERGQTLPVFPDCWVVQKVDSHYSIIPNEVFIDTYEKCS